MQVFVWNTDGRFDHLQSLGCVQNLRRVGRTGIRDHLLIWHWNNERDVFSFLNGWTPEGTEISNETVETLLDRDLKDARPTCRALLLLRGLVNAGFAPPLIQEYENKYNDRLHFLRIACNDPMPAQTEHQFEIFIEKVCRLRAKAKIPWGIIDPPGPPHNLTQVCILLTAIWNTQDRDKARIIASKIPHELIQRASTEYRERGGLDWPGTVPSDPNLAQQYASDIKQFLLN